MALWFCRWPWPTIVYASILMEALEVFDVAMIRQAFENLYIGDQNR